jgi:1,4-dihydroxy-2-naphthoate octaprenyltransferase
VNRWIRAARPLAHANIAPPLIFGQALAYSLEGDFDLGIALLVQLFGVFDHLYIVFANDAADWEADLRNDTFNRFSGGSRVVSDGLLTPRDLAFAAFYAILGMVAVSVYLVFVKWRMFMVLGCAAAVGLLWAYSFPPLRLSYRGRGEWLQGLGVGVVLPLIGYHAQAARLLGVPWPVLAGGMLLGWAGNLLTALPDAPSDARSGKRTFAVRHGERAARIAALAGVATAAVIVPMQADAPTWMRAVAMGVPLLPLAAALPLVGSAGATSPERCERFVFLGGGSIGAGWLGWSALWIAAAR